MQTKPQSVKAKKKKKIRCGRCLSIFISSCPRFFTAICQPPNRLFPSPFTTQFSPKADTQQTTTDPSLDRKLIKLTLPALSHQRQLFPFIPILQQQTQKHGILRSIDLVRPERLYFAIPGMHQTCRGLKDRRDSGSFFFYSASLPATVVHSKAQPAQFAMSFSCFFFFSR